MAVYGPIQSDARVIRSAKSLNEKGYTITIVSNKSDETFTSPWFANIYLRYNFKYLSLIRFWLRVLSIAKNRKICLLYLHDYYMPIVGKIYKVFTNKNWVYDAHELIISNNKRKTPSRMKFFAFLERISISSASLVIAANEERLDVMRKIYHLKNSVSVQNITDFTIKNQPIKNRDNIIVYQGAMMLSRHLDFYIRAHQYLPNDYSLLFVGDGDAKKQLETIVKELNIKDRVSFTGKVSQKDLYKYGCQAKIGIISYPMEGLNNYYCAPNKIFEYASLRIPMIGTPQPFLSRMFEKYHIGEIVPWDNVDLYLKAVERIVVNYDSYLDHMDDFLKENCWQKESTTLQRAVSAIAI